METLPRSTLLGLGAGFVGGLLGVGGGIIFVPGLVLLIGLDQRHAHASSVAIIVAAAAAAAVSFSTAGNVEWDAVPYLFVGAALGAPIGSRLLGRLSHRTLTNAFIVILLIAAVRMAF